MTLGKLIRYLLPHFQCPACNSGNTSGSYPGSWICHNCGAQGQS